MVSCIFSMKLDEITYNLPKERIALHPPKNRGESRLLVLNKESGKIQDSLYKQLADHLKPGDLLVLNNTRVLPARLLCKTKSGLERELLLLEKHGSGGIDNEHHRSKVMYRGKLKSGQQLFLDEHSITIDKLNDDGTAEVSSSSNLWDLAEAKGHVPLPPYMHRPDSAEDRRRYQTVFAKEKGSVAAPTASLNITEDLITELKQQGINIAELTLHVGLGTFMPIRVEDVTKHKMHQEYFELPTSTIEVIRSTKENRGRVVAVGTTVARTLEYAAGEILSSPTKRNTISGEADIFIYPGYNFKVIDGLLTNYHAPDSTVLMMAAAYAGPDTLLKAYEHALSKDYMFLSYGDSMLII